MGSESNQKGDDVWRQEFEKRYAQTWDDDGEKCVTRPAAHSFVLVLAEFKASKTSTVRAVYECMNALFWVRLMAIHLCGMHRKFTRKR